MWEELAAKWELTLDGEPLETRTSQLLPVRWRGRPAMLKIAMTAEEARGGGLMRWWEGKGAARVMAQSGNAILLERAMGPGSLPQMVLAGSDDAASRILCSVAGRLHERRTAPLPELVPLPDWFRSLWRAEASQGGPFADCAHVARQLLSETTEPVPLHGDIHHGNVLDFGERGWLAIDPKGLLGDRGFDYANLFCNPDLDVAADRGRLARQVAVVSEAAGLERARLLRWVVAWAGLSAAFLLEDNELSYLAQTLCVARLAAAELSTA